MRHRVEVELVVMYVPRKDVLVKLHDDAQGGSGSYARDQWTKKASFRTSVTSPRPMRKKSLDLSIQPNCCPPCLCTCYCLPVLIMHIAN